MNQKKWEELCAGDKARSSINVTQEYINRFAEVSGDNNPIHINQQYAEKTVFKKCIGHGLISLSEISKIVGTQMPGYGAVFINEKIDYLSPIYVGDTVITEIEIVEINREKKLIKVNATSFNQNGIQLIAGELLVKMM